MEEKEKVVEPSSDQDPQGQVDGNDVIEPDKQEKEGEDKSPIDEGAKPNEEQKGDDGEPKPKQSRQDNAFYAEQRRRAKEERERKELEDRIRKQTVFEMKKEGVQKGELESLGLEKVETDDELFLIEELRKAKAEGVENPEAKAYQALFSKKAMERKTLEEQSKKEEELKALVAKDQAAFKEKYGKTTMQVLKEEPDFKEFFDKFGKNDFTELYDYYHQIKGKVEKEFKDEAKGKSVPPTANNQGTPRGDGVIEPPKDPEEFRKYWERKYGSYR